MEDLNPAGRATVGIMYAGHKEYWTQFDGTREAHVEGAKRFREVVEQSRVDVVMPDLVDTVELSFEAGRRFEESGIDLLFVYLHSYVASGRWVPGIKHLNVPVVIVTFQEALDFDHLDEYMTGTGIRKGSACQLPEAYSALLRAGKEAADVIFGDVSGDPRVQEQIAEWCRVANVLRGYRDCVIGYLGHSYDGMLDMNFDPTAITRRFGIYVKMLEMCELVEYVESATGAEVKAKIAEMREVFEFLDDSPDPVTKPARPEDIEWAARCAVGLDRLVEENNLAGLTYYYAGLNNVYERVGSNLIVGNTLLTRRGLSLAGEADMKTCIAMKTTSALGAGGSFAEFNMADFEKDQVMVGHDGPHDLRITDARPVIRGLGLYHGKRGHGLSVEFSIRKGDMTMVSLGSDANGTFKFVVAEGQSVPGPLPQIGNSITRGYFGRDIASFLRDWAMRGVPHHMSLCVGHVGSVMKKLGRALQKDVERVR